MASLKPAIASSAGRRGRRRIAGALLLTLVLSARPVPAGDTAAVVEIVDGDTLRVRAGGRIRTVRLIGVDAPETSHPARPPGFLGAEAAARLASLCAGRTVVLERDAEDADRHGRLLRYVRLPGAPEDTRGAVPAPGRLANLEMIREGYARAIRRFPYVRREEFLRAEEEARRTGKGVWREGGLAELRWLREKGVAPAEVHAQGGGLFAVAHRGAGRAGIPGAELPAAVEALLRLGAENADAEYLDRARESGFLPLAGPAGAPPPAPSALPASPAASAPAGAVPEGPVPVPWEQVHRQVGRLVIVEGTVVRAHRGKGALYLNFHPNWTKYASVVVSARDLAKFPPDPGSLYLNRRVRVRGEVSSYRGRPEIAVTSPAAIIVLDGGARP